MLETLNRKVGWRGLAETLLLVVTVSLTFLCVSWHGAAMRTNRDLHDVMLRLAYTQSALAIAQGKKPGIMPYTGSLTNDPNWVSRRTMLGFSTNKLTKGTK